MIINKKWAMPNKDTFSIKPINELLHKTINGGQSVLDPFSNGEREFGTLTNDLNPDVDSDYHLDALQFLKQVDDSSQDVVLYDPPYSPRQVSESYKGFGKQVTALDTSAHWRRQHLDEIKRVLKNNGILVSFGWNTNGGGAKRGFLQEEILIVAHGGSHNDTLVTVEKLKKEN